MWKITRNDQNEIIKLLIDKSSFSNVKEFDYTQIYIAKKKEEEWIFEERCGYWENGDQDKWEYYENLLARRQSLSELVNFVTINYPHLDIMPNK